MLLNFNKCHVGKAEGAVTRSNRVSGLSGRVVWEGFPEEVTLKLRLCRGRGESAHPRLRCGRWVSMAQQEARQNRQRKPESLSVFKVQGEIIGGP